MPYYKSLSLPKKRCALQIYKYTGNFDAVIWTVLTIQLSHSFSSTSTAHGAKIECQNCNRSMYIHENLDTAKNEFCVGDKFAVCTVIQFGIVVVQFPLLEWTKKEVFRVN